MGGNLTQGSCSDPVVIITRNLQYPFHQLLAGVINADKEVPVKSRQF